MTDAAQIRAWLAAEGYDVSAKGAIRGDLRDIYDLAHANGNGQAAAGPDYPAGMGDDDFTDPPAEPAETKPERPRTARPVGKGGGWFRRKPKGKGKARARVPVDEVIGGAWRIMARFTAPLPPLQRTLKIQAPVAGLLLEDTVRGTIVDTVLQPIARFQNQGKALAALIGPPMLVTAGTVHLTQAQQAGNDPNPMFMGFIQEALRESLMLWMAVAGPKFSEALKREKEFEEHYGAEVDEFIAFLFAPPPDPADADAVRAEEEAVRRAQGML